MEKHHEPADCWIVIHNNAYDVSSFTRHPCGEAYYEGSGKDAATLFETRPMGSGTMHSDRARRVMDLFRIMTL